jgi:hypothetical protein
MLESPMAIRIAGWCITYYDTYKKAPGKHIEDIYFAQLKKGLPKSIAEEIEEDILPGLSEEYETQSLNVSYLIDQTKTYFNSRQLTNHIEGIQELIARGEVLEAEKVALTYKPILKDNVSDLNLSDVAALKQIEIAFAEASLPVIRYPKQLGNFLNSQMVRGGFVAFMASEKRGKSFFLLDMAMRAVKQKAKVAFFQAGDMTESQQMRRICINLARKSDLDKYTGKMFEPVRDCVFNQIDNCTKPERECSFGIFNKTEKDVRYAITFEELKNALEDNPDYKPCYNCKEYEHHKIGAVWIKQVEVKNKLEVNEAKEVYDKFFIKNKRQIMLSTHANSTLSVSQIETLLDVWEQKDFTPDLIIIDYADLLVPDVKMEYRHQQNDIWKRLRGLSQKKHCLIVTATQADADSYGRNRLGLKNFSEDKRKYSHVTAMYGMNQDPDGREKKIGIMRLNELVVREGDFDNTNEVWILQNLKRGLPVLVSYF